MEIGENNMEYIHNKTTQLIALVSINGTLAVFGYTGATYVNRLENLEAKIGGISEAEDMAQDIENRMEAIETSIEFINKSIDDGINPSFKVQSQNITELKGAVSVLKVQIETLKDAVEDDNPLLN